MQARVPAAGVVVFGFVLGARRRSAKVSMGYEVIVYGQHNAASTISIEPDTAPHGYEAVTSARSPEKSGKCIEITLGNFFGSL